MHQCLIYYINKQVNVNRLIRMLYKLDCIEQGLTSHQTHYRSYWGRVFYGSNDLTNSVKALKEDRF